MMTADLCQTLIGNRQIIVVEQRLERTRSQIFFRLRKVRQRQRSVTDLCHTGTGILHSGEIRRKAHHRREIEAVGQRFDILVRAANGDEVILALVEDEAGALPFGYGQYDGISVCVGVVPLGVILHMDDRQIGGIERAASSAIHGEIQLCSISQLCLAALGMIGAVLIDIGSRPAVHAVFTLHERF